MNENRKVKHVLAAATTTALLVALVVTAVVRSGSAVANTPEECLDSMFEAMKSGDTAAYFECFTGTLRDQLERTARGQGAASFSQYLRDTAAPVKGRAVFGSESAGPDRVAVKVDRVYENRMWEYQTYRLVQQSGSWKIYEIDTAEPHSPPVPYGTPAYATQPEPSKQSASDH